MFIEILNKIKEYNRIIIHRHVRPDGDCIGSQMGLKHFLKHNFKEKEIYAVGSDIPEYLKHLGSFDEISDELYKDALVIVVDTATSKRIHDSRWEKGAYIIKIDHHDDSPEYGDICYVDPKVPSCSSIIVSMIKSWGSDLQMSKEAAYALYMGIVTDTGRFRYRGISPELFNNAAFLLEQDIDTEHLYTNLYIDTVETLKLNGYVLNNFKTTPNGVAYIYFTKKIMNKYKVTKEDAANLVNSLSSIKGYPVWVVFVDQLLPKDPNNKNKLEKPENEIRCRLRSRGVAINSVASNYRGGGHLQAAGATIYSKNEMKSLLNELDKLVKEYKEANPNAF